MLNFHPWGWEESGWRTVVSQYYAVQNNNIILTSTFEQNNRTMIPPHEGNSVRTSPYWLSSDIMQQYMYLHIIIALFMLMNLQIFKCGQLIRNEVNNNYL